METKVNGIHPWGNASSSSAAPSTNGHHITSQELPKGLEDEPSLEELERELPVVHDGQVPLRELLQRIMQVIYAELTEMAETCVMSLLP